jgi:peptide/nickel transport system ATP-binding protein
MAGLSKEQGPGRAREAVLQVRDLETHFFTRSGSLPAVKGVSFSLHAGETLGLVGESGCGKSATAMSMLRLIPPRAGKVTGGSVIYAGHDLLRLGEAAMRRVRGKDISMIFQEPMTALNPVLTVGYQIAETMRMHNEISAQEAMARAVEMLSLVQVPDAERRIHEYPHQLSGGMRQRVMIAMALACNPKVLIADEPTTALDVTIQAQILDLMLELQEKLDTAIIMISHDLGVIAELAHRVIVMYAGRKIEEAEVEPLFDTPRHPYTQALMRAIPRLGSSADDNPKRRLSAIDGMVPALRKMPAGCAFAPRCSMATEICRRETPPVEEKAPGHWAACWNSRA